MKVVISPAKINYHRKVTLKDTDIDKDPRKQLETFCNDYTYIISKHAMDIGTTNLVQMSLQPEYNIKPIHQGTYMLYLSHYA